MHSQIPPEDPSHRQIIRTKCFSCIDRYPIQTSAINNTFREPYGENAQCDWRVSLSPGSTISIIISDLELEEQSECVFDSLEVRKYAHFYTELT